MTFHAYQRVRVFRVIIACMAVVLSAVAFGQSEYQGTYSGYSYFRLEGPVTQPETANGIAIAIVANDGSVSVQDGGATGMVNAQGVITWNQPNGLFLTSGSIVDGILRADGSSSSGAVTTFTRLELKAGGGYDSAASLDDYFTQINPANNLVDQVRVLHDGQRFVSLGEKGTISISMDGVTWETRHTGSLENLNDLAYGDGTWLAVGDANTVLTSTDLTTWVPRASGVGDLQKWPVASAAFYNGRFYLVNIIGAVVRSSDATGSTWEAPLIAGDALNGLGQGKLRVLNNRLYFSGKRLFSPNAELQYTIDGATFQACAFDIGFNSILNLSYGNGVYVANGGTYYGRSTDGVNFVRQTSPLSFGFVGFDGTRFIARGLGSSNNPFRYSADASAWTTGAVGSIVGVNDVAHAGGMIVGVGDFGRRSADGLAWTGIASGLIAPELLGNGGFSNQVIFGNGIYLYYGSAGSNYASRDGVTWSAAPATNLIAFGNGVFVSPLGVSVDGVTWSPVDFGLNQGEVIGRIGFNGTSFLATAGNRALVSTNGVNWQHVNPGSNITSIGTLTGGNGQWIALGTGGSYSRSLDGGVTWTTQTLGNASLTAASYGNGRWVVVAGNGRIYAGNSLANLVSVGPVLTAGGGYDSLVFIDGLFFARRENFGTYFVSDGLAGSPWVEKTYAFSSRLTSVAQGPDFALIAGANHSVLRVERNAVGHPVITGQPAAAITVVQDEDLLLSGTSIGNGPLTYRWYRNGKLLENGGRVSGADTIMLAVEDIRPTDAGTYSLVVVNADGSAVSEPSIVTVNAKAVAITPPQSVVVTPGGDVNFSVVASADATAYQWLKNGVPIPGATMPTLTITDVDLEDVAIYQVRLTNEFGDSVSDPASLSFKAVASGLSPDLTYNANVPVFSFAAAKGIGGATSASITIRKIHELADGKILLGGQFGYGDGAAARYGLIRLNADGTRDTSFNIPLFREFQNSTYYTANVEDFAVLSDGRVVVVYGHQLNMLNNDFLPSPVKVMMFDTNGNRVNAFAPAFANNAAVTSVVVDSQDRIIFGGTQIVGSGSSTLKHVARFTADGVLDGAFDGRNSIIALSNIRTRTMNLADNDSLVLVGTNTSSRTVMTKLTSSGTLSPGFSVADFGASTVQFTGLEMVSGGKLIATGNFTTVNAVARKFIARFEGSGALDTGFVPAPSFNSGLLYAAQQLPDDTVIGGGSFYYTLDQTFAPGTYFQNLMLFNPQGDADLDSSFGFETSVAASNFPFFSLQVSADQSAVYAGRFVSALNPPTARRFMRFSNAAGALPNAPELEIVRESGGMYAEPGDRVTFAVAAVGGDLSFQWRKDGQAISGETKPNLTISPVGLENAGTYTVVVTDDSGSIFSSGMMLMIPGATMAPTFGSWREQYGLTVGNDGFGDDANGDGVANGFKYLFDLNPMVSAPLQIEVPHPSGSPTASASSIESINDGAGLLSPGLDEEKTYRVVSFRLPANMKGLTFDIEPSTSLFFGNGSANAHEFGEPVVDGDFLIHSYYLTPAVEDAPRLFWRLGLYE